MDDDDGNLHDYDAKLYVGGLEIASMANEIPLELLSVFTDEMHRTRTATEAAYPQIEPGDVINQFAAPGPIVADRLDILGFTPVRVLHAIDRVLDEARRLADLVHEYAPEGSETVDDTERSRLAGFTATDWIAELGLLAHGSVPTGGHRLESTDWLMSLITDVDRRIALRAALIACPGAEVRLDVTHLYATRLSHFLAGTWWGRVQGGGERWCWHRLPLAGTTGGVQRAVGAVLGWWPRCHGARTRSRRASGSRTGRWSHRPTG